MRCLCMEIDLTLHPYILRLPMSFLLGFVVPLILRLFYLPVVVLHRLQPNDVLHSDKQLDFITAKRTHIIDTRREEIIPPKQTLMISNI